MNKFEKQAFVDAVLTQRPDATIRVSIHRIIGEKEAKSFAESLAELVSGKVDLEVSGSNWYRVSGEEVDAAIFFERTTQDYIEQKKRRYKQIKQEMEQIEKQLDGYMIEDVAWGIEEAEV